MKQERIARESATAGLPGGLAGWLLGKLQKGTRRQPRLALLERISLAPKQSLSLVEAEGRKFLVATSAEGSPSFYPLDAHSRSSRMGSGSAVRTGGRVSW